ncbi:hypothetical protein TSOC_000666 [Tetrabaena socialis]|uniref:BFN domain-containing protein n=1 Tax=Tetrabaena socialis TaxID=47790 RepID=A0A2J8AIM1_9CHLO|nr:hypothetical protein TSOC_000666 [Tetrabaena socialis]|eukprot:PNH12366.1 hypothetical protein TSOC_000666 [Tetrabaena socialis]
MALSATSRGAARCRTRAGPQGLAPIGLIRTTGNDFSPSGFAWSEQDYFRVSLLERAPYGPMKILPAVDQSSNSSSASGVLVFQRPQDHALTPETPILEIFVAGDTATNLYTQLHGHSSSRPMAHDLMYDIVARVAEASHGQWQLLRVAVTCLEQDIFHGRLFFGDPATGTVAWDFDCRPSDGVYLSLRAAVPIRHSKVHMIACAEHMAAAQQQQGQQQTAQQQQGQQQQGQSEASSSSASSAAGTARAGGAHHGNGHHKKDKQGAAGDYMTLRPDDPEAITLLKRELAVAVRRIEAFQHVGSEQEADTLRHELAAMIERSSHP